MSTRCRCMERMAAALLTLGTLSVFGAAPAAPVPIPASLPPLPSPLPAGLSADDRQQMERDLKSLAEKLATIRAAVRDASQLDRLPDVELFLKGVVWALRYETSLTADNVALLKKSLPRGLQRADALLANQTPWTAKKGNILREFISAVDGSTQSAVLVGRRLSVSRTHGSGISWRSHFHARCARWLRRNRQEILRRC